MPAPRSSVVIACAGSRKTSSLVEDALKVTSGRVLITTFTNECVDHIEAGLVERAGCVPPNITVLTWFSFLLQECIRPYQNHLVKAGRIGSIDYNSEVNRFTPRNQREAYYLNARDDVFKDRAADFACAVNDASGGLVIGRLERIYGHIFIDELQDMAGWDIDLLSLLLRSKITVRALGDPRQATFHTTRSSKNKGQCGENIGVWAEKMRKAGLAVVETRNQCYRSNQLICDFADAIFPLMVRSKSVGVSSTEHDGVVEIPLAAVPEYYAKYRPVVLRYNKRSNTGGLSAHNIGGMKGRTFDRVLIFPTPNFKKFLKTRKPEDAGDRIKLYIAVTRARFSVAFVV